LKRLMTEVTFITGNLHKAEMYAKLLGRPIQHQRVDLDEIQSESFIEVATRKVEQAYTAIGKPVFIDDFGLSMDDWYGLPGPFTKFFAAPDERLENLCAIAGTLPSRRAKVVSVLAYKDATHMEVFVREVAGSVATGPRGDRGIATDKIFEPDGYGGRTRAELDEAAYQEVYMKVRPISEFVAFLDQL